MDWTLIVAIIIFHASSDGGASVHTQKIEFQNQRLCENARMVLVSSDRNKWGISTTRIDTWGWPCIQYSEAFCNGVIQGGHQPHASN
jgi:hypothetical protein